MSQIKLPGLIDVHTHLRVPGGEHKEDFATGTAAALAGGLTMILGMPNTSPPLTTRQRLADTRANAQQNAYCDVGLFAGASREFLVDLPNAAQEAVALKIYLNDTFGTLRVDTLPTLLACFETWPREKLIAMHAEGQSVAVGIGLATSYQRPVHFCHISRQEEIELIAQAKMHGLPVTCEVTPHHLFMTEADFKRLGPLADMRPKLATQADVDALWAHLDSTIDCIATDHAPHTLAEKQSENYPPGIAGLETSLPLMLTAIQENRISMPRVIELMHTNPRRIFKLPLQTDTYIEIDPTAEQTIRNEVMHSKCGWTPFAGQTLTGRVERVLLRGQTAFEAGQVVAIPGSGVVL
ncbi:amidohydrolase family protein [Anaerolineales bacterium HSG6]|nr:amidohydrolase family protein [Anaerolineales bacterium HSG6]